MHSLKKKLEVRVHSYFVLPQIRNNDIKYHHSTYLVSQHKSKSLHVFVFEMFPFCVSIILQCGFFRTVLSISVGATLVVSGDGRYYSEQAIQVLLTYTPSLPFNVDFFASLETDLSILLFSASELIPSLCKTSHLHCF